MPDGSSARPAPADERIDPAHAARRDRSAGAGTPPGGGWSWPNFTRNALLIAGLVALSVWFAVEGVVPNLVPKNFGTVDEGAVYRSGELTTAAMASVIERHGVRTIIDFGAHDHHPDDERRERALAQTMGVRRVVLPLRGDARGDPNRYAEALRIMTDPDAQPVLVHCAAGSERTGCAVALYRSIVQGWDDERALAETTEYRHDPSDNPNLRPMYERFRDDIERALRDGTPVPFDPGDFLCEPAPGDATLSPGPGAEMPSHTLPPARGGDGADG